MHCWYDGGSLTQIKQYLRYVTLPKGYLSKRDYYLRMNEREEGRRYRLTTSIHFIILLLLLVRSICCTISVNRYIYTNGDDDDEGLHGWYS